MGHVKSCPEVSRRCVGFCAFACALSTDSDWRKAFEAVAVRGADFPGLGDFNLFDGALCDAFAVALPVCLFFVLLLVLVAVAPRVFEGAVFADLADWARIAFPAEGLKDFLRVFLDIRLPFVAFRGSTNRVMRVSSRTAGFAPIAGQV